MAKPAANPPPFRPTGLGLGNKLPNFPASKENANAVFTNLAVNASQGYLSKLYAFVPDLERAFSVSGDYGQSAYARTWYPKNFQEGDMKILVQVANQYEYDRLVTFVAHHHRTAIAYGAKSDTKIGADDFAVDFKLFKALMRPGNNARVVVPPQHLLVMITDVDAGHERFKGAPVATLTCRVVDDFRQPRVEVAAKIYDKLTTSYMQTFGNKYNPAQDASTGINSGNDSQSSPDDPNSWWSQLTNVSQSAGRGD